MMNLSHEASNSEIPENFDDESGRDSTQVLTHNPSNKERVLGCLTEAGGESLSIDEIVELTDLSESIVTKILRKLSRVDLETREVFEDENAPDSFFLTEPLLDRLAVGF